MRSNQLKLQDFSLNGLVKRCQELESRGYECVRRVMKEDDKFTAVYKRIV